MSLLERLNRKQRTIVSTNLNNRKQSEQKSKDNLMREGAYQSFKSDIHTRIVNEMPEELQTILNQPNADRREIQRIIERMTNEALQENPFAVPLGERNRFLNELTSEILGLGPIETLLKDENITEIMINGYDNIYVEQKGLITKTNIKFRNEEHLMNIIDRIVSSVGRRVDESSPLVDARLADGSRVNIIIPPLALNGACVTIRKFAKDKLTIDNLIEFNSISSSMAEFIKYCVEAKLNIIVSGGTGSGKTTLLNICSSFIPENERIITIEDSAELQLNQEHLVTLETRPANIEGKGEITIRDLVKNALRMRPDRIIVGEVRTGEALDMLQAMNTGHDGSMTTVHANSPRDLLSRLETMVLMSGMELPLKAIRDNIASSIDLVIQIARLRDGSRKIVSITEVVGMEGDIITMQELFKYQQHGMNEDGKIIGEFVSMGIRPHCIEKLECAGINLDWDMFMN